MGPRTKTQLGGLGVSGEGLDFGQPCCLHVPSPRLCPQAPGHPCSQHPPAGPEQRRAPEAALGPREFGAHSSMTRFCAPGGISEHRQGPQLGKREWGGVAVHLSEEEPQALPQLSSGVSELPSPMTLCPRL